MKLLVRLAFLAVSLPFFAQQPAVPPAQQAVAPANAEGATPEIDALHLDSGDLLDISVFGVPDLSQQARINSSGDLSLALIGKVHLAGLTPDQAQALIEQKLKDGDFVKDPHVSILVKEYATQGVSVMGEVSKPGIYPMLGPRRLFDVVSAAGGMTPKAGREVTITRRTSPEKPLTVKFSGDPAASLESNVPIYPGDTVVVSKAGLVYVVGDVGQPGGFVLDNNADLSVLQAVALAHGANHTASLKSTKIIRKGPDGSLKEIAIPLDKILSAQSPDLTLVAGDIVFVPNSRVKSAAKRGLESIVQVATGVAIYRP